MEQALQPALTARDVAAFLAHGTEFRDNKGLQEPAQIKAAMQLGISNLQKMGAFGNMDKSSMHWSLDLDKDPLGQAAYQERQAALEGGKEARKEDDSAASSAYGGRR